MVLRCFDGVMVPVPTALARRRSELVAAAAGQRVVDVPGNVYGPVVAMVAAYWEGHAAATSTAAAATFDAAFLAGLHAARRARGPHPRRAPAGRRRALRTLQVPGLSDQELSPTIGSSSCGPS